MKKPILITTILLSIFGIVLSLIIWKYPRPIIKQGETVGFFNPLNPFSRQEEALAPFAKTDKTLIETFTIGDFQIETFECLDWAGPKYIKNQLKFKNKIICDNGIKLGEYNYQFSISTDTRIEINTLYDTIKLLRL